MMIDFEHINYGKFVDSDCICDTVEKMNDALKKVYNDDCVELYMHDGDYKIYIFSNRYQAFILAFDDEDYYDECCDVFRQGELVYVHDKGDDEDE